MRCFQVFQGLFQLFRRGHEDELEMNEKIALRSFSQSFRHPGHSAVSFVVLFQSHMKRAIKSMRRDDPYNAQE